MLRYFNLTDQGQGFYHRVNLHYIPASVNLMSYVYYDITVAQSFLSTPQEPFQEHRSLPKTTGMILETMEFLMVYNYRN